MYTEDTLRAILPSEAYVQAALDPVWNRRGLRPVESQIHTTPIVLPDMVRDFMCFIGEVTGGTVVIHGGPLDDIAHNRIPKDYDGIVLTKGLHPLDVMDRVRQARHIWRERDIPEPKPKAPRFRVLPMNPRIQLSWKKLELKTSHGKFDLNFILKREDETLSGFMKQMADQSDVGVCARSEIATHGGRAFQAQRCIDDEARGTLTFRAFRNDSERFVHLTRWFKYAVAKYPEREVVYASEGDAEIFANINARRAEFLERFTELSAPGRRVPVDFKPFRSMIPELYDRLATKAKTQLVL
jgi:hypothetical protein